MPRLLGLTSAFAIVVAASLALAAPPPSKDKAPEWSRDELRQLLARIQSAARAPTVAAQDLTLVRIAAAAYRVKNVSNGPVEQLAKRVLRARESTHPSVQSGQWLTALTRRLYLDLSERCRFVSRFERSREDRRYYDQMAAQTAQVAEQLGQRLVLVVEGLDEVTEPLPAVGGGPSVDLGVKARVHDGGVVTIQRLDRVRFVGHQPPDDHPRTITGALKEVYGAQKQANTFAQTMGKYDKQHRDQVGHVQLLVPASYPAIYLNEIVRGALEAGMHTLHLKTMTPRGELRELALRLQPDKKKKRRRKRKKASKLIEVTCANDQPMEKCARKLKQAGLQGRVLYRTQ